MDATTLALAKSYTRSYVDEYIGEQGHILQYMHAGEVLPTHRPAGEDVPLVAGDFVRPYATEAFPCKVYTDATHTTEIEFENRNSTISWTGVGWLPDAHTFQKSNEVALNNKATESLSGTALYQSNINIENVEAIKNRVEKSTIDNKQLLYARENGTEKTVIYGAGVDLGSGTIPTRTIGGAINVGTPTADAHAATKAYVDAKTSGMVFEQATAADVWNIAHNMAAYPCVTVLDSAGNTCIGQIEYIDTNNIKLTFNAAFSGKAYLS